MRNLVEVIARALLDKPEDLSVQEVDGKKTTIFELTVAAADLGKVIGKQGKTARTMRTMLSASGTKIGKRTSLEILQQQTAASE
ncbi:MAG: KH domain-containing protein [Nitrospirae bacterium]|nr:KH domain-containing protein [Nitrospirota bacterium]